MKTKEQKEAWLDGFKAATNSAKHFKVRIGHLEVDETLNLGIKMVGDMLQQQVDTFEEAEQ